MGWREIETMRSKNTTLKREARQWRDDELKKEEADRKVKHKQVEEDHKLGVDQIKNSYIEQIMRLDDELRVLIAAGR
jgi:hypothetical protein